VPEDELNRVTKVGQHFGSPFCYQGDFLDPEFGWGQVVRQPRSPS
jgi:glucose/arabinose dehydrogenase